MAEPSKSQNRAAVALLGIALVLLGITMNPWSVGRTLAGDGEIDSPALLALLFAIEAAACFIGLVFLVRGARVPKAGAIAFVVLPLAAFGAIQTWRTRSDLLESERKLALLESINASEDLLQTLTARLGDWNWSLMNLEFPDAHARALFAPEVSACDLVPEGPEEALPLGGGLVRSRTWGVDPAMVTSSREDLALLEPFFERVDYLDHGKFYFWRGAFRDEATFVSEMGISALARMLSGEWASLGGKLEVVWTRDGAEDGEEPIWSVSEFRLQELHSIESERKLFREDLDRALPDPETRAEARRSVHEEMVIARALDPNWDAPQWFTREATDRHPGLAVVDWNGDGFDDIYVLSRWNTNLFLENQGDGTFLERGAELGLDLDGRSSSAVFCDLDNDGDPDCVVGRTLARSRVFENTGDGFRDVSAAFGDALPFCVSSVSAVDVDSDGLLDLYFSTYAARMIHQEMGKGGAMDPSSGDLGSVSEGAFLRGYLPDGDAEELYRRYRTIGHPILDRPGPPNVLLRNRGGGPANFEPVRDGAGDVAVWRNTFQTTFVDWDGDGDQDAYVANDFAPNNFLRNDGGKFVDVTEETGTADVGFGMGADFGDYNNDGTLDLYVTNMFSKAGRRITSQIATLDPRFAEFARGNSLFRGEGGSFEKVSGLAPPALQVEKAGWSWGGQFLDIDNDGYLDVHALSGHFTAPKEIAIPVDT